MSTLLVVGVVFLLAFETRRRMRWAAFGVTALLLIGARSGTGLAGIIFVITAWNWLRTFAKQQKRMTAPFVFFSLAGVLISMVVGLSTLPIILAAYGKDATFTGRTKPKGERGPCIAVMSSSESLFLGPWIPFICLCRGMTLRAEQPLRRRSRRKLGCRSFGRTIECCLTQESRSCVPVAFMNSWPVVQRAFFS